MLDYEPEPGLITEAREKWLETVKDNLDDGFRDFAFEIVEDYVHSKDFEAMAEEHCRQRGWREPE